MVITTCLSGLLNLAGDLVSGYEQAHSPIDSVETKDVVRALIDARELRQEALAGLVHQSNLSAILAEKRKISAALASKLGKFFEISPAMFLPK